MRSIVRAFLGPPGSGKTYLMATRAAEWRRANPRKPIFSTFELRLPGVFPLDPPGDIFGRYAPVPLLEASNGLVIIDEAALLFDSRMYQKTPMAMLHRLMQYRKLGIELWWSTQFPEYVDKRLKLLTVESLSLQSFNRVPLLPFFVAIKHERVGGPWMGLDLCFRTPFRDSIYDTRGMVGRANYYGDSAKGHRDGIRLQSGSG
jgi:hypothetical protein